jgi:hypothetical protein
MYLHPLADLAQTEVSVEWAIRELHREEDKAEDQHFFYPALSRLLCGADPKLVATRIKEIAAAPGFNKDNMPELEDRMQIATWSAEQCWTELENICAAGVGKQEVDFYHTSRVVEALARQGESYVERILDLLGKEIEDFDNDPMTWMENYLVMLAGEMRLDRAIPPIVKKFHEMGEVLSENCIDALGKIGTDAAAEAVADGWLETEWDYRLYATSALEKIHSDATVRKCLELLPAEKDRTIKTKLADALLAQCADEAIEPVRQLVQARGYDWTQSDLMARLVAVSTILDVTFPEYPIWKQEAEERRARYERSMREMNTRLFAPAPAPRPVASKERDDLFERKAMPFLRTKNQVLRNDPCPCGSGKKFKKCCMKR